MKTDRPLPRLAPGARPGRGILGGPGPPDRRAAGTAPVPSLTLGRPAEAREADARPLEWGIVLRLLGYTRPHRSKTLWLLLLVVVRSIQLPCLTWLVALVIKGPVADRDTRGILLGVLAFALLALSTQLVMHFRQRLAMELGELVVGALRNDLFAHLQTMTMAYFGRVRLGRIISRMASDVELVRVGVQEVLFVSVVQVGQMIVAASFMAWYDIRLFLLVLAIAPLLWVINRSFHRVLSQALRDVQESFSRVTATVAESVGGVRVTQGFVRQDTNARLFADLVADHSRYNLAVSRAQATYLPLFDLTGQMLTALLLVVGGYQVLRGHGTTEVGDLIGFFFMSGMFFSPITALGNQYHQALTAMAGAERVFQLLDARPDWSDPPAATELGRIRGDVRLERVVFAYKTGRPVLHDVSFAVVAGQTVALVGPSGGGKSTILNLVAKFHLPLSGTVRIDGHDLATVASRSLHRQMGIVLQQNFLFTGSVRDNIRIARPAATEAEVREVLRRLDCLDLIEALPHGLDTQVGERGTGISLGQRQLVCFARALLADPRILILDEATSSIDTLTEARIQRALATLLAGRTSFVVAHRMSTVRHADLVLVVDGGRIVEQGTHWDLLRAGGVYARLHRQFVAMPGVAAESGP